MYTDSESAQKQRVMRIVILCGQWKLLCEGIQGLYIGMAAANNCIENETEHEKKHSGIHRKVHTMKQSKMKWQ